MSFLKISADTAPIRVLLGASIVLFVGGAIFAGKLAIGNALATRSQERQVTEVGAMLASSDPLARLAHAGVLERTFDMSSIAASLAEYEAAASLSPHDYRLWLGLGRARERDGDRPGAELAYRRASGLAPHYSRVHWALGNLLVREGRIDEGFEHIRKGELQMARTLVDAHDESPHIAAEAETLTWVEAAGSTSRGHQRDLEQLMPVATGARQAGHLDAENDPTWSSPTSATRRWKPGRPSIDCPERPRSSSITTTWSADHASCVARSTKAY